MKKCICCTEVIDENFQEFDTGTDKGNNIIHYCEECSDYSPKSFSHFLYKNNTRRMNQYNINRKG